MEFAPKTANAVDARLSQSAPVEVAFHADTESPRPLAWEREVLESRDIASNERLQSLASSAPKNIRRFLFGGATPPPDTEMRASLPLLAKAAILIIGVPVGLIAFWYLWMWLCSVGVCLVQG